MGKNPFLARTLYKTGEICPLERKKRSSPFPRAENFSVHELIDPIETRPKLISWIDLAIESQTPNIEPYKTTMLP